MKTMLLFSLMLICKVGISQTVNTNDNEENKIFIKEEQPASFPDGDTAWNNFLSRNLNTDIIIANEAPKGTYTVSIRFIVMRDSTIKDVSALSRNGYGIEDEVVRIVKKSGKWIPAMQNDRQVNAVKDL